MFSLGIFALALVYRSPLALASPFARPDSANEGVYLTSCTADNGLNNTQWNELDFYRNVQNGQEPKPDSIAMLPSGDGPAVWEGGPVFGDFLDSETRFLWNIETDARSQPVGTVVGNASNSWDTQYSCYYHPQRPLYFEVGFTCESVYLCSVNPLAPSSS